MTTHGSLYETITNDLIGELEQGVAPWVKPWTTSGGGLSLLPHNAASGHRYRGVNVLLLWSASLRKGYRSPAWIGYHQAHEQGHHRHRRAPPAAARADRARAAQGLPAVEGDRLPALVLAAGGGARRR